MKWSKTFIVSILIASVSLFAVNVVGLDVSEQTASSLSGIATDGNPGDH